MGSSIITLTTDFGLRDSYVAEMKGVILSINPQATIVDVSHEIKKFDIRMGAYVLASTVPWFPRDTVHVGVVDPGVGRGRRSVIVRTERGCFVGPDNGLFALAVKNSGKTEVYRISNPKLVSSRVSSTFHGRDVFAPAAAYLAKGTPLPEFGPRMSRIRTPPFAGVIARKNTFLGKVVHVDDFGNIITNLSAAELGALKDKGSVAIRMGNAELRLKLCRVYGDVEEQEPLAIVGSHGFLEISVNRGNAAEVFSVSVGNDVAVRRQQRTRP